VSDASCPNQDEPRDRSSDAARWRQDEIVARILRRWRALTGDKHTRDSQRRTLIACSGGIDSVALAFALAQVPHACVFAHIRHDIREDSETRVDAELVMRLAESWGVKYVESTVRIKALEGNLEANAREYRYAALAQLALDNGCRFIATGHHADDQLETLLLSLLRGTGVKAMGGMRACRSLKQSTLVRPMLEIERAELVSLLRRAGLSWREDPTNRDTSFERNRIRHELMPVLTKFEPRMPVNASQWAQDLQGLHELAQERLKQVVCLRVDAGGVMCMWERSALRSVPDVVLGLVPHWVCEQMNNREGQDAITRRAIESWIRTLKSEITDPSEHRIGPIVSKIDAHRVSMQPADYTSSMMDGDVL
jgi:tRNA(Ile)-lysidine synthetase-like protein